MDIIIKYYKVTKSGKEIINFFLCNTYETLRKTAGVCLYSINFWLSQTCSSLSEA